MSKGMKSESEKYRTTGKKKDLQLKEGVKKDRMGFRSNGKKQEKRYLRSEYRGEATGNKKERRNGAQ
jgi:hypothetical protein